LGRDFKITGIATQGFEALSDYYVKRYRVSHSRNGLRWSIFQQVMKGNRDGRSVMRHNFTPPVYARYIRVYPKTYKYRICMRMELYGCLDCKFLICDFSFSFLIKCKLIAWQAASFVGACLSNMTL